MNVIDLLWAQLPAPVFITREQFERGLEGWTIEPVEIDGVLAFAAMTKGPEFHFASFGAGKPITRTMIMDRLNPIMDRHGYVETVTPKTMPRQIAFNLRWGFKQVGEDEFFLRFRLEKPCQ